MRKKVLISNFLIIFSFMLLSGLFMFYLSRYGKIIIGNDATFHLSRVEEIYRNLKDGNLFTFIATHTFHQTGVANFIFYPNVFLYPWVIFRFFKGPIMSFYMWYGMFTWLTLIISYYSMLSFTKGNKIRSYIFSIIYATANYRLHLGIFGLILGEFQAYTFLPLIFVSIYNILYEYRKKSWIWLSIGMTCLIYSHLLSVYVTVLFIFLIVVIFFLEKLKVKKEQIFDLLKAVIATAVLSSPILFLFLNEILSNDIATPNKSFIFITSLSDVVLKSMDNSIEFNTIGLILISTIFVGWYFTKKSKKEFIVYLLGSLIFISTTSIIPWEILSKTVIFQILGVIQFPYRLLSYSILFLSVSTSLILYKLITYNVKRKRNSYMRFVVIIGILIGNYFSMNQVMINRFNQLNGNYLHSTTSKVKFIPEESVVYDENYNNIFKYIMQWGGADYYHKSAFENEEYKKSIWNKEAYLNKKKVKISGFSSSANKFNIKLKLLNDGKVDLPIILYKNLIVKVNGKRIPFENSDRGTVSFNAKKGLNEVELKYDAPKLYYVLVIISLLTWLFYICFGIKTLKNNQGLK